MAQSGLASFSTSSPARILPLGDSLTLGVQGQGGGYRTFLGQALKGYGPEPYDAGFVGALYLAGDHSGYSGHTIAGIESALRAAKTMEFMEAARLRDELFALEARRKEVKG